MVNDAKIVLSQQELQLVTNTDWILTKRAIIEKIYRLFGELSQQYQIAVEAAKGILPATVQSASPKISKGENYLGLPYVVLDHPRLYEKENMLTIRTMFWWGHFFSITLQVSGSYKKIIENKLLQNKINNPDEQLYLCVSDDQWQHHFEENNYIPLHALDTGAIQEIVAARPFIKIAAKYPLAQWEQIPLLLNNMFNKMLLMLAD